MGELLTADFVEHHMTPIHWTEIPESWGLDSHELYYQLDMRMCFIQTLTYAFHWDSESLFKSHLPSILETPSNIIRLDISQNKLTSLPHDGLLPFQNLRVLDTSHNKLKYMHGIEVLHNLFLLNLSNNSIIKVQGLLNCYNLEELNLSNNLIKDISSIPSQINLRVLNINNNKLQSLEGATSFPKLEEIYADNNELRDLVHLSACFHLHILSAANNHIKSLNCVLPLIYQLRHLQILNLSGNPVVRERTYQSDILRVGSIMSLDNVSVRPVSTATDNPYDGRLQLARDRMEKNVNFLQKRTLSEGDIREPYPKHHDVPPYHSWQKDTVLLDPLSQQPSPLRKKTVYKFCKRDLISTSRHKQRIPKNDYSNIKDTDELLRCTYNELIRQRSTNLN